MSRYLNTLKTVRKLTKKLKYEDILNGQIDSITSKISELTQINRSNVSRELNKLVREEKLVKIKSNPVIFLDKEILEKLMSVNFSGRVVFNSIDEVIEFSSNKQNIEAMDDPFSRVVGYNGSLNVPIKQAKAAILYPPNGLHSLITGGTGTGKTTFAELMYKYALLNNIVAQDSSFVIFNCSEYADNPQLLLSQLYGHAKGAFTGADKEKIGLIEKANNGIILLDEIHRLPPEGQEMLFLVMDKGIFRRMGETDNYRHVNTIIIGATTEDTNSSLLQTFLRRIPMLIRLPKLSDRPLDERYILTRSFFNEEFRNIKTPIKVHNDVIKALLLYDCSGNIGQLKSDIQLLCARGFLDFKTYNKKVINIENSIMPEYIYSGLFKLNENRDILYKVIGRVNYHYETFSETRNERLTDIDDYKMSKDIYEEISLNYHKYEMQGYSKKRIKEIIVNDIEDYFNKLLDNFKLRNSSIDKEALFKILSPEVLEIVQFAMKRTKEIYGLDYSENLIVSLSMHISSLIKKIKENTNSYSPGISNISLNNNEYYKISKMIIGIIEEHLNLSIPKEEINLITVLLSSLNKAKPISRVGILIIAHGDSTASSMADVANKLLNTNHCKAINMPLSKRIDTVLDEAINTVKSINEGKGVLLLVDMGSLVTFSEIISKRTGIETKAIEMVSTPIVIESLRKSLYLDCTLDEIAADISLINPYVSRTSLGNQITKKGLRKKIITNCITGKGTAKKIADFIRKSIPLINQYNIDIESLSYDEYDKLNLNMQSEEINQILALVGTFCPTSSSKIPYISIDELIVGDGLRKLEYLITGEKYDEDTLLSNEFNLYISILKETLIFLDPIKTYKLINEVLIKIGRELDSDYNISFNIRFITHVGCMIERSLKNEALSFNNIEDFINSNLKTYKAIKDNIVIIEEEFGVQVCDTEVGYLIELLNTL